MYINFIYIFPVVIFLRLPQIIFKLDRRHDVASHSKRPSSVLSNCRNHPRVCVYIRLRSFRAIFFDKYDLVEYTMFERTINKLFHRQFTTSCGYGPLELLLSCTLMEVTGQSHSCYIRLYIRHTSCTMYIYIRQTWLSFTFRV